MTTERLDAEIVFRRLEELRELLRLASFLSGFVPVSRPAGAVASELPDGTPADGPTEPDRG